VFGKDKVTHVRIDQAPVPASDVTQDMIRGRRPRLGPYGLRLQIHQEVEGTVVHVAANLPATKPKGQAL
jgi:hypothetical protein